MRARDRIVELVRVRASDLHDHPANWRIHPKAQRAALAGLLAEIGYADALLARRDGDSLVVIDGHLRKSLDPDQIVPVLVLDVSEDEAEKLLATLDPLAALARPDPEALADLLERVRTSSEAVADLLEALARAAALGLQAVLSDPEEIPPSAPARTGPGDLWVIGNHRLLCGDATSERDMVRLMASERADLLLTDPPYGVSYVGKTRRALTIKGDRPGGLEELLRSAFSVAGRVLQEGAPIYVFSPAGAHSLSFASAFVAQGFRLHQTLVWVKDQPVLGHSDYHYRHEPILYGYAPSRVRRGRGAGGWYGGNDQSSVIEVERPAASRDHPTAKPVELIRRLISNSSRRDQVVLDPFSGSGATLLACELLGRRCRAMELDPSYCDVAVARYEGLTGGKARLERARRRGT